MKIAITIDTDSVNQNNSKWNIQNLDFGYFDEMQAFYDRAKRRGFPVTTFVRIDEQVAAVMRDPLHLYNNVKTVCDVGYHELGWHPHVFELNQETWVQVTDDEKIVEQLNATYSNNQSVISGMNGVRMGGAQGSARILGVLQSFGFIYDSSCLVGCRQQNYHRWYDWTKSLNEVFYPSKENYQVEGKDPIGIKEVPMTTMYCMTSYDISLRRRAVNPAYHPQVFRNGIDQFFDSTINNELIVISFHADELLDGYCDDLFEYGSMNIWDNIGYLEKVLQYNNISYFCHKMSEL